MNKAFVKEPDGSLARCPKCDSPGTPVGAETLQAQLSSEWLDKLTESAYFCPYARCPVVYFDQFDRTVPESAVKTPVFPKNPDAPLCACFGLTRDDVEQDIRDGIPTRVRALLEKAKSPEASCAISSPSGQCCVPEVQRCYLKLRSV